MLIDCGQIQIKTINTFECNYSSSASCFCSITPFIKFKERQMPLSLNYQDIRNILKNIEIEDYQKIKKEIVDDIINNN